MRTLVIVKPDAFAAGHLEKIVLMIQSRGFELVFYTIQTLTEKEVAQFYSEHVGKDFFQAHSDFMTSGPCVPIIFEGGILAISRMRKLVGATNPLDADQGTIRYCFGNGLPRNAVHTSDSPESAEIEINFFFPEKVLDVFDYN